MKISATSMQHHSHWLGLPLLAALLACGYSEEEAAGLPDENDVVQVRSAEVDTDAQLTDIVPGEGAGVFVEYETGGRWVIRTACDSEIFGVECFWDVLVTPLESDVLSFEALELESTDTLRYQQGSLRLIAENSNGIDGFALEAAVGTPLRVDAFLDGAPGHRYIFWVGGGGVHQGAPSNPIDLTPTLP